MPRSAFELTWAGQRCQPRFGGGCVGARARPRSRRVVHSRQEGRPADGRARRQHPVQQHSNAVHVCTIFGVTHNITDARFEQFRVSVTGFLGCISRLVVSLAYRPSADVVVRLQHLPRPRANVSDEIMDAFLQSIRDLIFRIVLAAPSAMRHEFNLRTGPPTVDALNGSIDVLHDTLSALNDTLSQLNDKVEQNRVEFERDMAELRAESQRFWAELQADTERAKVELQRFWAELRADAERAKVELQRAMAELRADAEHDKVELLGRMQKSSSAPLPGHVHEEL